MFENWLIGSIPGRARPPRCGCWPAAALDPLAELWIHELKGTGDLDPLESVSHRFVSGIDDVSIGYAAESCAAAAAEIVRRPRD